MNEYITVKEAARVSGYSRHHITHLLRGGKVRGGRWGGMWMVNRRSLIEYLAVSNSETDGRYGPKRKEKHHE